MNHPRRTSAKITLQLETLDERIAPANLGLGALHAEMAHHHAATLSRLEGHLHASHLQHHHAQASMISGHAHKFNGARFRLQRHAARRSQCPAVRSRVRSRQLPQSRRFPWPPRSPRRWPTHDTEPGTRSPRHTGPGAGRHDKQSACKPARECRQHPERDLSGVSEVQAGRRDRDIHFVVVSVRRDPGIRRPGRRARQWLG